MDLSQKSGRRAAFQTFAIYAVKWILEHIDPNEDIPIPDNYRIRALTVLETALKSKEVWPSTRDLLFTIAPKMERSEYRKEWIPILQEGFQQSQSMKDKSAEGELCFRLGVIHILLRSWVKADFWLQKSLCSFKLLEDAYRQARTLNRLARVSQLQHNYIQANKYINRAFELLPIEHIEREYSYFILIFNKSRHTLQ